MNILNFWLVHRIVGGTMDELDLKQENNGKTIIMVKIRWVWAVRCSTVRPWGCLCPRLSSAPQPHQTDNFHSTLVRLFITPQKLVQMRACRSLAAPFISTTPSGFAGRCQQDLGDACNSMLWRSWWTQHRSSAGCCLQHCSSPCGLIKINTQHK